MNSKKSLFIISEASKKKALNLVEKLQLNSKQRKFCFEFIKDYNTEKASERAGFSSTYGYKLLNKNEIRHCIQLLQITMIAYQGISEETLMGQMAIWCNADITDFFENDWSLKPLNQLTAEQASCIQSVKCKVDRFGNTEVNITLVDKMKANMALGRTYGLYVPPKDMNDEIDNMSEEELEALINDY